MLLITLLLVTSSTPFVPYLDTNYEFHMNYTGERVSGEPMIAFTCSDDSLSLDSLATYYPSVVQLSEEQFSELIDNPNEFCERFGR